MKGDEVEEVKNIFGILHRAIFLSIAKFCTRPFLVLEKFFILNFKFFSKNPLRAK